MALPPSIRPQTIVSLVERDIHEPPAFIEPSILPVGGQLIIAARAKTGKSFVSLDLARAMCCGGKPWGVPEFTVPRPLKVLMLEQELGEFGLRKRVAKLYTDEEIRRQGAFADNFMYVSKVPELKLDDRKGLQLIYDLCDEVQPDVLLLDPLGRFHNCNDNDNQEVGKLMDTITELQKMFAHNQMAVVMSMHMGKPPDTRAGFDLLDPYQIRGASKYFDNVDGVITMQRTHNLKTDWEAWSLNVRFTLRHGESPDDLILHVNSKNDNRVRYYSNREGVKLISLLDKTKPTVPTQAAIGVSPA